MRYKKLIDEPEEGFTTALLSKVIDGRVFAVDMCWGPEESRAFTAHRLRNYRRALREFSLHEPKKVVDIVPINL